VPDHYTLPFSPRGFAVYAYILLAILVLPALVVVPVSFSSGSIIAFPLPGFSLQWYAEALASVAWRDAVVNSAIIGVNTAVLATVLGTAGALGLRRLPMGVRRVVFSMTLLPLLIPIVILALGGYLALAEVGLTNTYTGVIVMHTMLGLPFVVISVSAALEAFDDNLWRAAIGLGASPLLAFRRVMLPLILPGVLTGAIFAFATSLDEVVVAAFVASPTQRTIPLHMFSGIKENTGPIVATVATLLLIVSALFMAVIEYLRRRSERIVVSGTDLGAESL
jgi:putative spermidine/putrescine transport system permease protein